MDGEDDAGDPMSDRTTTTPPTTDLAAELRRATADALDAVAARLAGRVYSPRIKLLTIAQVCEATTLGESTVYRMVEDGKFPKPQRGVGKNLWRESAIIAWCDRNDPNRGEGE
jgi:excisionase family DNA binding protein